MPVPAAKVAPRYRWILLAVVVAVLAVLAVALQGGAATADPDLATPFL